jgi:hypothetical protein
MRTEQHGGKTFQVHNDLECPIEVSMSYTTLGKVIDLARACGFESLGLVSEEGGAITTIRGAAAIRDFMEALERGLGVIDARPLAYEETGGPGTGRATLIGQPTHVGPEAWLAGREGMVQGVINVCKWALEQHDATSPDPVWVSFV